MFIALLYTFLGFAFAISLGLFGAWSGEFAGGLFGVCGGLGLAFLATAYVAGHDA